MKQPTEQTTHTYTIEMCVCPKCGQKHNKKKEALRGI